jgi:hypothetical protein
MTGMYKELLPKYDLVYDFVAKYQPCSLVDWGCASGKLLNRVAEDFPGIQESAGYDPGNPDYDIVPSGAYDCLVSCDVIEHIEPDQLDASFKLMQSKFRRSAFLIAACYPAKKILDDGHSVRSGRYFFVSSFLQKFTIQLATSLIKTLSLLT